jgi:magnesium chelatase family protein
LETGECIMARATAAWSAPARISGRLMNKMDIRVDVVAGSAIDLLRPAPAEKSVEIASRVARATRPRKSSFQRAAITAC